ncbi:MAG: 3-deoxy-D-manno-octulosonic acid transferase(EC [uncultured Pyrinomonadaceae bacterium]|uniref:3-deoxy-D-manno-octulosonic acid transferase n=1 Tax=uncultured Pyrinomonadaceae bacterium TaxID=2283094 RepID=A0A6J4PR28_9BACT|nr:MAG: 3-deoxy-D-manno-octulosonic acid transferase(EC [uncultured Pyrinomonadaceae bacterium]
MFLLYSFLLTVGFIILLPRFLFQEKYQAGWRERFGNLPDFQASEKPLLWLHCVSVGETNAARPLVEELKKNFPEYRLVVSTTTKTGQDLAKKVFATDAELVFYFPFDWKFTVRRALNKIKPDAILIMETEIWFNFVREARRSGAKVFLVNGRLSEKSFSRYSLIPKTMRRVLHYIDLALMQTRADVERLVNLGMRRSKIKVTGNIKFDQAFAETEEALTGEFQRRFAATAEDAPLIIAASTHAPEERWILQAFGAMRKNLKENTPRLLIAPRHPERFAEVEELIKASGFVSVRRSATESSGDATAEVILLDSIGELRAVYPLARIVFVGGSLIPHGGQNILEPAMNERAIVTGFYTMNFAEIVKEFAARNALIRLPKLAEDEIPDALASVFAELTQDAARREELAKNAFGVMKINRGATEKTVEYIKSFLAASA